MSPGSRYENRGISIYFTKKNVQRHIFAPSAVACDILHLRASAHFRHAVPFI